MNNLYFTLFFLTFTFYGSAQSTTADTTDLYVINDNGRLVSITTGGNKKYAFFFRSLKSPRPNKELLFKSADEVVKFFEMCEKALALNKTFITSGFNISRNTLNKNVVRMNDKGGDYTLLKRETIELMREAYEKSTQ